MTKEQAFQVNEIVYCIDESSYNIHLTKHKAYTVLEVGTGAKWGKIRIKGNMGHLVWLYDLCFSKTNPPKIASINIDDKIRNPHKCAIEVTITFENGQRYWTTFMTTAHLSNLIESQNYFQFSKVVYVNVVTPSLIYKIIYEMDKNNQLLDVIQAYPN